MKMIDWIPNAYIYEYPGVPLNLVGWQGSQVNAHVKALVGTVNTSSLNLATDKGGSIGFAYDFVWLISLEEAPV